MSKLTHILKVILLGPQPKDEWYEAWSKDPLAEWFREQSVGATTAEKLQILRRNSIGNWLFNVLIWGSILWMWLEPDAYRGISSRLFALLMFCYFAFVLIGKSRKRRNRPSGKIMDLVWPSPHESAIIDLWRCGFQGRDVARNAYLQKVAGFGYLELSVLFALTFAAQMLIMSWGDFPRAVALIVFLLIVFNHARRFCYYRCVRPFGSPLIWTKSDLPGVRVLREWELSEPGGLLNRLAIPLWPLIASPVLIYSMRKSVSERLITEWTGIMVLLVIAILSIILMHVLARGRTAEELAFVEQVFEIADKDFDQWVRTELIGDEDALR